MPFIEVEKVRYFIFDNMLNEGIDHAIFSRRGGVSPKPWESLNMGATVGDDLNRVIENRKRAFKIKGRTVESMFDVWQVHSSDVICTDVPRPLERIPQKADAILTNKTDVTLFMRFADCVPILLLDPRRKIVGLVHAGWLGTARKIVEKTILQMKAEYNSQPKDILAGIGPSIGPDHYEVGQDVVSEVEKGFGALADQVLQMNNGAVHFDLWEANRLLLERSGVDKVELSSICTACHLDDWFSHRGERGKTGRFGAMIGLS
jgi:YfiH family protein